MKEFKLAGGTVSLLLFIDVTNSNELLKAMQEGTLEPEVAFLDASMIPDAFPVLAAAQKALIAKTRESLTTRTLHSELVYNYSGSKHITESLRRCGISDSSSYVLAARFNASPEEIKAIEDLVTGKEMSTPSYPEKNKIKAIEDLVTGKEMNLDELEGRADKAKIQKHYKISGLELGISSLADAITCRIAVRDAL